MAKLKIVISSIFSAIIFAGCSVPFLAKEPSALKINSNVVASVYINGNHVGETPHYDEKLKPGDYTVRLLVEDDPVKDWQTQVTLASKIVSVIHKDFGPSEVESANYLLQLEPLENKEAMELSILTIPDNVIVNVDGQPQGFSPVSLKDVKEGDHVILLSAPGYQEMTLNAQTKLGYKLIASITMGRQSQTRETLTEATPSAEIASPPATSSPTLKAGVTPTPTPTKTTLTPTPKRTATASGSAEIARPYVTIKETGTGWLRVRETASGTSDNEIGRVNVGESFPYLESSNTGWYKIEYEAGKEGWITARYAELFK
jgi:hypothetical protein